jgi:hypothetical protein
MVQPCSLESRSMVGNFFREYIFKLVVTVAVTATITTFAVIGKYWNWPNAVVGTLLLLCAMFYLTDKLGIKAFAEIARARLAGDVRL